MFAARIHGADLRNVDDAGMVAEIKAALAKYAVCAIGHEAPLTDEEHIRFARILGPMERSTKKIAGTEKRVPFSEIVDQSNLDETGEIYADDDRRLAFKRANRLWHTDMSFYEVRATYSLLSAHVVPPAGGETEFVDMRAVCDALPPPLVAELERFTGEHCYWYSRKLGGGPDPTAEERASRPPARHPLVHVHAPSGRKALYIASHVSHIVGMPADSSSLLLGELMAYATEKRFVYAHKWRLGDVLIWDNLSTMHRATEFDDRKYKRDMRRATCREREIGQAA
jgi:alpha-ketoglutarate-dependent 2,4-dichlorophenoxyacetate dioxygenase